MIIDFLLVLMTKNLSQQRFFYETVLGLDLISDNEDTVSLGKDQRLYLVLREDKSEESHHLTEHKGPQIITFKCKGDVNSFLSRIKNAGGKIRDSLRLDAYNAYYVFIEDYDGNELCLEFPLLDNR